MIVTTQQIRDVIFYIDPKTAQASVAVAYLHLAICTATRPNDIYCIMTLAGSKERSAVLSTYSACKAHDEAYNL